jgi:hypothetical protein
MRFAPTIDTSAPGGVTLLTVRSDLFDRLLQ